MATTWAGWERDFLNAANVLLTPPCLDFMTAWHKQEGGSCTFNPVDLSTAVTGSTRCGDTVAGFGRTQNYATHAQAEHAFVIQLNTDWVQPLQAALNTGNPFQIGDRSRVVAVLKRWGSPVFADWYANATTSGTSGGPSGGGGVAPHTHKAWGDLQRSVNKKMPASLGESARLRRKALRDLRHVFRVTR